MKILSPRGLRPGGRWMLPAEFEDADYYTMASPSSQMILESRGLLGLGAARPETTARRMRTSRGGHIRPGRQLRTTSRQEFNSWLQQVTAEVESKGYRVQTEERSGYGPKGHLDAVGYYVAGKVLGSQVYWDGPDEFTGWINFHIARNLPPARGALRGLGADIQCETGRGGVFVCDIHQRGMMGMPTGRVAGSGLRLRRFPEMSVQAFGEFRPRWIAEQPHFKRLEWARFQGNVPL